MSPFFYLYSFIFFHSFGSHNSKTSQRQTKKWSASINCKIQRFPLAASHWWRRRRRRRRSNEFCLLLSSVRGDAIVKDVGFVKKQVKVSETNRPVCYWITLRHTGHFFACKWAARPFLWCLLSRCASALLQCCTTQTHGHTRKKSANKKRAKQTVEKREKEEVFFFLF